MFSQKTNKRINKLFVSILKFTTQHLPNLCSETPKSKEKMGGSALTLGVWVGRLMVKIMAITSPIPVF